MESSRPRAYELSGSAPTVRARSALARAIHNLDRWERAYLGGRGAERVLAYRALMQDVADAQRAMTEGDQAADDRIMRNPEGYAYDDSDVRRLARPDGVPDHPFSPLYPTARVCQHCGLPASDHATEAELRSLAGDR